MKAETASFVAKWWADHLRAVATDTNMERAQVGLGPQAAALMDPLMSDRAARDRVDPVRARKVDAFESVLRRILLGDESPRVRLSVDYDPCRELCQALAVAGLEANLTCGLPWKTHTRIDGDEVTAREGYRAPRVVIWNDGPVAKDEAESSV